MMEPERMTGVPELVAPVRTQSVCTGQASCESVETAAPVGRVSAAKVTLVLGVVAPYRTTGAELVRPVRRHSVVNGQFNPLSDVTVVPPGKASALKVQAGATTPSPAVTVAATTAAAEAVVPVTTQKVETAVEGQARPVMLVKVTDVGLGEVAAQPSPYPPETMIGVPALGEVLVPVATHPPEAAGQVRLVSPAMVPVPEIASFTQTSGLIEVVDTTAAAPAVVLPVATHWVAEGQVNWVRAAMPAGTVSAVKATPVVGEERMTAPAEP